MNPSAASVLKCFLEFLRLKMVLGGLKVMLELDRVHGAHTFLIFVLALIQDKCSL